MSHLRRLLCIVIFVLSGVSGLNLSQAMSAPISFAYEGTVSTVNDPALNSLINQAIRFEYSFESTTVDNDIPTLSIGRYGLGLLSFSVHIDGLLYAATGPFAAGDLTVSNGGFGSGDKYDVGSQITGPSINGAQPETGVLQFIDDTETVFSDDSLPLTPPEPQDFNQVSLRLLGTDSNGSRGDLLFVNNIHVAPVPAPSAAWLFGSGLLGLLAFRGTWRRLMS